MKYYNVLEAKNALSNKRKPRVSLTASFIHEAFPSKLQFYFQILLTSERVRFLQDSNFLQYELSYRTLCRSQEN